MNRARFAYNHVRACAHTIHILKDVQDYWGVWNERRNSNRPGNKNGSRKNT